MYYREFITLSYKECRGSRNGPDNMMFSSHEIGKIKGIFSNYQRYNDSDVSVSVRAGYYDVEVSVRSRLDKGDYWCRSAVNEALSLVRSIIVENCRADSGSVTITVELET